MSSILKSEAQSHKPIIILIRPQMGENIGAVARAMSNFGLEELRIVAPRDGWPNAAAIATSSGAEDIIHTAKLFPDFRSAVADIQVAYATTARPRDMNKRVVTPAEAMLEIAPSPQKIALVFGPERTGIENEEINLCDTIVTIPTSTKKASLNLAQSVVIMGYEWIKASGDVKVSVGSEPPAPKEEMFRLFTQLEDYLDTSEYWRTDNKKTIMWQNLRNMLIRGAWSEQEIRSFRGVLRSLWERSK